MRAKIFHKMEGVILMKKVLAVAGLSLALALAACGKGGDGQVLARVNRAKITVADYKRQIEELAPQMQQAVAIDPKARKEFLEDLIGIEVVLQEARRQGLDKDAEFKKKLEAYQKDMELKIQEAVKNELFNNLLKKELADKLSKLAPPTDKEVREYYNKNKDKIRTAAGKQLTLKEIEPQLKSRMTQEKQRDVYVEYAKGLKAKAKVSIDDKALDEMGKKLAEPPATASPHLQTPPAKAEGGK